MRSFKTNRIPAPPLCLLWPKTKFHRRAFEIGAGNGEFARNFASRNPDCFLVSVERTKNKFLAFKNDLQMNNLFFLRADAISILVHCVPDQSLDHIFLLYPNPYPKKKQANQRWHNMSFIQVLKQKLKPNGRLELRTNIRSYFDEAKAEFTGRHGMNIAEEHLLSDPLVAETAFERKYLARGECCYQVRFGLSCS